MRATVLTSCLLLFVTTLSPGQDRSKDEAGIRKSVAAYERAVNARDVAALAAVFAPDADAVFFDSPRRVGRDSIAASHRDVLAEWPATRKFSLAVTHIRFLGPELALIETRAGFSEGESRSNRGTILVQRRSGDWQWAALRVYPDERE